MNSCHQDECVYCTVSMRFSSKADALSAQELLLSTVARTHAKYECLDCRIATDENHAHTILYTEQWGCEAAFINHAASDEFRRVLNAIDLSCEVPEVKVERLYTEKGIDCFQRILEQAASAQRPVHSEKNGPAN